ncbi:MAG: hypothetical protein BAA01_05785 [Bacillus thermozeamaize]|jgi:regulator of replication initiation timing|uniref:Uncharacterized protein n=1 Tax=Bacillus thermozeamaize TaxID=230954 RepID=A0A1Y3PK18_9BACI|nr:MAG: hypothetical protein BAA01_05785 [Bacillus thermozeamaize]
MQKITMQKAASLSTKALLRRLQQFEGQLSSLYQKRNQMQYLIDELVEQRIYVLRELEKRGVRNGKVRVIENREPKNNQPISQ